MVWIAENPRYDADDKQLLKYLGIHLNKPNSDKIVKTLSLYKYLKKQKITSPKDIELSAYYDKERTHPVFSPKVARSLFSMMKQSGGAGDEAIVVDKIIRGMIGYIQGYLPEPITNVSNNAYYAVTILKRLEQMPGFGPFVDIGKEAFVQGTKTFVVGANDIAKDLGGPVGAAAVSLPAAIATMLVVVTHLLEDELGEAVLVSFLAVPFVGTTLYKAAGSLGKFGRKVFEHKDTIVGTTRTFLGDTISQDVEYLIPNMNKVSVQGAKRFSTRRNKVYKWKRTRSAKR